MKKVLDLILGSSGAILTLEFFLILVKGEIKPLPNFPVFVTVTIITIVVVGFGAAAVAKGVGIVGCLLCGVGSGLFLAHVIAPVVTTVIPGYPISEYAMVEPNMAILLGELGLSAWITTFGFTGLFKKGA